MVLDKCYNAISTIQKTIPFSLIFFVKLNKKKKIVRLLAFTKTINNNTLITISKFVYNKI